MQKIVWTCSYCAEKVSKEDTLELKLHSVHGKGEPSRLP